LALYELGRPAEALAVTAEAVAILRELAAASPDRYRPDLAEALDSLAAVLAALDRSVDSEVARDECAKLRQSDR
jgi:hypothetical protein